MKKILQYLRKDYVIRKWYQVFSRDQHGDKNQDPNLIPFYYTSKQSFIPSLDKVTNINKSHIM